MPFDKKYLFPTDYHYTINLLDCKQFFDEFFA